MNVTAKIIRKALQLRSTARLISNNKAQNSSDLIDQKHFHWNTPSKGTQPQAEISYIGHL